METAPETSSTVVGGSDEGLGLGPVPQKLTRTETGMFPFKMMMMQPFPSSSSNSSSSSSSSVGPTFYGGSDLYDGAGSAAAAAGAGTRTLQPFHTAFRSPGMAASMRFPFTSLQWQELERQALIYKYMVASMPVPPELLMHFCSGRTQITDPPSTALAPHSNLGRSCFNLRFSNSIDPEPGRCRRTDGKKWRCSRDVAPDQKYCERHMHRGRPRSRKPVEVPAQNQPRLTHPTADTVAALSNLSPTPVSSSLHHHHHHHHQQQHQTSGYFPKADINLPSPLMVSTATTEREPGYLDPIAANQPWQLMDANLGMRATSNGGTNAPVLQPYEDHSRLNYTDFCSAAVETERNDQCSSLYLNNDLTSLADPDSDRRPPSRGFIDAWSITSRENPITTSTTTASRSCAQKDKNLPISSLSLSMSSGDGTNLEDKDQIQMGLGVNDFEGDNNGSLKRQASSWIKPANWLSSSPLGGPLGEVLQSSAAAGSNSASPRACEGGLNLLTDGWGDVGNALERPSRLDSSPSGVLHKTLVSPSDSSSSSSPTFAAAAKSEIALQWLCHGKLSS